MYRTYAFNYNDEFISISGITIKSAEYTIINDSNESYSKILDYHLLYVEKDFKNFRLNGEILSADSGSIIILEPGTSHIEFLKKQVFPGILLCAFRS